MYILDTDHLSLIQRNGREGKRIVNRLVAADIEQLTVTVITYEEQIRGRLSVLTKAKMLEQQTRAYRGLYQLSLDYQVLTVIPFTQAAGLKNQQLRKLYPRLGNMDLKIAAIAMENEATLLTRNASDFEKIEGLQVEDWSR
ncbi:MAG: type II toxin-antitoxin system VapC family toxin [Cyanobacteria bacterium J06649_4]